LTEQPVKTAEQPEATRGIVTEITGTSIGANSIGQKSRSSNIDEIILRAYGEDKECQSDT